MAVVFSMIMEMYHIKIGVLAQCRGFIHIKFGLVT
jgi:hypothetical protein